MAKPTPRTCQHANEGGQNVPNPKLCGKLAKWFINLANGRKEDLCGIHCQFWRNRGFTPLPIITIKENLS